MFGDFYIVVVLVVGKVVSWNVEEGKDVLKDDEVVKI